MKRLITNLCFFVLALLLMLSCQKNNPVKSLPSYQSLTHVIGDQERLGIFKLAIQKCGLDVELSSLDTFYTVFAPSDSAFLAAALTPDSIGRMDPKKLAVLLRYHIAQGIFPGSLLPTEYVAPLLMSDSISAYIFGYSGLMINGAFLDTADIQAQNGVMHIVGQVMNLPDHTLLQFIHQDPDLSYLSAALRVLAWDSSFFRTLDPVTFFAPTNEAFIAKGFNDTTQFPAQSNMLNQALGSSLVIRQYVFPSPALDASAYDGNFINITGTAGAFRAGITTTGKSAAIVSANRLSSDGVLHKIDHIIGN